MDTHFAVYLLIAVGWTTLFSMTIRQPVRGLRNLGILACYVLAVVMFIRLRFVAALITWLAFGVVSAVAYIGYQLLAHARDKNPDKKLEVSFSTFIHAPLAWPIMLPEAVEYSLAELGVLRVSSTPPPKKEEPPPAG
jgi:hypothetical protein